MSYTLFGQNTEDLKVKLAEFNVNKLLFESYEFDSKSSIQTLERKLNFELNSIKSLILASVHKDEFLLNNSDIELLKERALEIAIQIKRKNIHLIFLKEHNGFYFQVVNRPRNGNRDYLISHENFPFYFKQHSLFVELVKIIDQETKS